MRLEYEGRGWLLGGDEFVENLKPLLSDFAALKELPRRERLTGRPSLPKLFAKVRGEQEHNARIHEALRVHGYTLQEVADATGLHYSTASRIAKRVAQGRSAEIRRTPRR